MKASTELLEMLLLDGGGAGAEGQSRNRRARGLVIEAQLDKGQRTGGHGPRTERNAPGSGDPICGGSLSHGKVRAMMDDKGRTRERSGSVYARSRSWVLTDVPECRGNLCRLQRHEKEARNFSETFISAEGRVKLLDDTKIRDCPWTICLHRFRKEI